MSIINWGGLKCWCAQYVCQFVTEQQKQKHTKCDMLICSRCLPNPNILAIFLDKTLCECTKRKQSIIHSKVKTQSIFGLKRQIMYYNTHLGFALFQLSF